MKFLEYIPVISGLMIPLSTFINLQSITVPYPRTNPKFAMFHFVSLLGFGFGLISTIALFIRMLEKKIKWSTRTTIAAAILQSICIFISLFLYQIFKHGNDLSIIELLVYKLTSGIGSLCGGILYSYHILQNKNQVYSWTLYDLSLEQRQLILLTICSFSWIGIWSFIYSHIEGWTFEFALYWCVCSFTTIGFGDYSPKSHFGMLGVPIVTFVGIALVGGNIWSMRNVFLQSLTVSLVKEYSKFFQEGQIEEEVLLGPQFSIANEKAPKTGRRMPSPEIQASPEIGPSRDSNSRLLPPDIGKLSISPSSEYGGSSSNIDIPRTSKLNINKNIADPVNLMLPPPASSLPTETDIKKAFNNEITGENPELHRRTPKRVTRHLSILDNQRPRTLPRTFTISRSKNLPILSITTNNSVTKKTLKQATETTILNQMIYSSLFVLSNILISAGVFAYLEGWNFLEGVYFSYVSFMTIGYGDYVLETFVARSFFIWFIFIAISSSTYMLSMISEYFGEQWEIERGVIEKRMGRYETKAKWKNMYGKKYQKNESTENLLSSGEELRTSDTSSESDGQSMRRDGLDRDALETPLPTVYSISLSKSFDSVGRRMMHDKFRDSQ